MKILVDIGHPAHVHFFKNMIWKLEENGHEILITSRDKDVSLKLLDIYRLKYKCVGKYRKNIILKIIDLLKIDYNIYRITKKFCPDLILGFGSINAAHASFFTKKPCIIFDDDEYSYKFYKQFAKIICTTHTFKVDLGKKHIKFKGFKELAYLHPLYFKPNPDILVELGLNENDDFIIIRFVGWNAFHDAGKSGLGSQKKIFFVEELRKYTRVLISCENSLPPELEKYKIAIPPDKIHDVLYFAQLLIGDTQTMTTEAAILGTPAIRCNLWVGKDDMLNFIELEQKYGLIFNYNDPNKALEKAVELIQKSRPREEWRKISETLLKDKIDLTAFMARLVEDYPKSYDEIREIKMSNR